jgi:thioredoxin reductase
MPDKIYDVIIIGGSAAGLSAAMTLGRSLRNILIIDNSSPCNRQSPRSHNFITQDGRTPAEIVELAKEQVLKYTTTEFIQDKVTTAGKNGVFHIETESGKQFRAQKILLCTGLTDITPEISGFSECWGISILHCPYCHGYEMKDETTAILANGQAAYNTGMLIHNWTKNLTILTNGVSELRHEEQVKLEELGINILENEISGIAHENGSLDKIIFKDGTHFVAKAMYASIPFRQQSDLAEMLGCQITEHGHIVVNDDQMTTIEGIYAAGDNTAQHRAISVASASGTKAGFAINTALTTN